MHLFLVEWLVPFVEMGVVFCGSEQVFNLFDFDLLTAMKPSSGLDMFGHDFQKWFNCSIHQLKKICIHDPEVVCTEC